MGGRSKESGCGKAGRNK